MKPIKGKGGTITLLDSGVLVRERQPFCSCLGGGDAGKTFKLRWDDIIESKFDHTCFAGTMMLKSQDGRTTTFSGSIWSMRPAINVIYKRLRGELPEMDKIEKAYSNKISFENEGVMVKKTTGCCSGSDTLVPWTSVLKVSLHASLFHTKFSLETMIPNQVVGDPQGNAGLPKFERVTIRGRRAPLEDLFGVVLSVFKEKRQENDASDPSASQTHCKRGTLNALGLIGVERSCFREHRHFVPYHMITSLDWEQPRCRPSRLVIVDRVGQQVALHGTDEDAHVDQAVYEKCRSVWVNRSDHPDKEKDFLIRKNMKLSSQGLHLTTGSCFSGYKEKFYNWEQVDVCEIASTCCGAQLTLITESGDRAGWRGFSKRAMMDTMMQIQKFKYKNVDNMDSLNKRNFGGSFRRNPCLLTDKNIRIVTPTGHCSDLQCFIDLDSVKDVNLKVVPKCGCRSTSFLLFSVDERIGRGLQIDDALAAKYDVKLDANAQQRIILVELSGSDNGEDLVRDIRKRAKDRHNKESKMF